MWIKVLWCVKWPRCTEFFLFQWAKKKPWISPNPSLIRLIFIAFLFIVLRSAQHPQIPRFLQIFRGIWPMPLSLLNHSALALFAQRTRIPTSARSIGFCAIWVCISSSSSSIPNEISSKIAFIGQGYFSGSPSCQRNLHVSRMPSIWRQESPQPYWKPGSGFL